MLTVFGSIIIDNIFSVPALPQQGETILAHGLWVGPGGKGANQAVAAARTGHPTRMVGSVGTDGTSTIALDALRKHGVDISSVQTAERPTGSAAVMVDPAGANAIAVAPGANGATRIAQMTDALWQDTTTLLLQMEIPFPEIESAIFEAQDRGICSILNLAPAAALSESAFRAVDLLIANEVELEQLATMLALPTTNPEDMAERAAETLGHDLLVTWGEKGAWLLSDGTILKAPALPIAPVDTTGAGDAFCGVFAASLDAGMDKHAALQRGCAAGSLACLGLGAQESLPSADDIDQALWPS